MRATQNAPRGPCRLLECCYGLAEIGERGAFVTEHCRAMAPSRGGRSLEADVAARLPKECLVVVASTDGVRLESML